MSLAPAPGLAAPPRLSTGLGGPARIGAVGAVVLMALFVGWAVITPIAGAVIASGSAVVRGKPQLVQHLDGGIVAEIDVRTGDRVSAGQVLLRLDPSLLSVNLQISRNRLAEAMARRARLQAEQLGLEAPRFVYDALPFPAPDTARPEQGQRQIFAARAALIEGQAEQTREKVLQLENQIAGVDAQIAAKQDQLAFLEQDLGNVTTLNEKGLVRESQMLDLQRQRSDMLGQIAALDSERARLSNAIRDAEIGALQARRQFAEEVVTDLRATTAEIEELIPQIVTTMKQLDRVDIRAPVTGVVHEMQASTVGGVVAPGATILEVIPLDRGVEFELRLDPRAVDQVHPGQAAQVVMAALDPRQTPKLNGTVGTVSPGTITDPATGQRFYRVTVDVPPDEIARLGADVALVPGMPVEAFLETGERTVAAYLLKPLTAQLARAFRED